MNIFVDFPANVVVTTFTINFSGMDDGARVTIFNSLYPGGLVVPGSYVYLGGTGTTKTSAGGGRLRPAAVARDPTSFMPRNAFALDGAGKASPLARAWQAYGRACLTEIGAVQESRRNLKGLGGHF